MVCNIRRILGVLLLSFGIGLVMCPVGEAGFVATVVVEGKVTADDSGPIPGTKVHVEIIGWNGATPSFLFTGQHQTIVTNRRGVYSTNPLGIPAGIPQKHLYARIIVVKPYGPPFYSTVAKDVSLAGFSGNTWKVQANFALNLPHHYGAFVSGTVRDLESWERLQGVGLTRILWTTDADGRFLGTIPLSGPTQVVAFNSQSDAVSNGIAYTPMTQNVTLESGKSSTLDFPLTRVDPQTEVVGRVVDGGTGKSIPYALVNLSMRVTSPTGPYPSYGMSSDSVTDVFGRFQLRVPISPPGDIVNFIKVYTNGAFLAYDDPGAPYPLQTFDVTGRLVGPSGAIRVGEVIDVDFSM